MLLVLVACLTCGCEALDPVTRNDAKNYVENRLGLKNFDIFGLYIDFDGGPYMWNDRKSQTP